MVSSTPPASRKRTGTTRTAPKRAAARDPRAFARALRRFRQVRGLTQQQLAERAGISVEAVGALERGDRRRPRKESLDRLADALALLPRDRAAFQALAGQRRLDDTSPIGREREWAWLQRELSGERPLVLIAGKPGLGKSHLLGTATEWAAACGWQVLAAGCLRGSGSEPYAPLTGAIKGSIRSLPASGKSAQLGGCAWLVRLLPELLDEGVLEAPRHTLPADQERRLMIEAIERYLENIGGAETLLVLDDLQWAGSDTVDLLTHLIRRARTGRVRILAAYRSTELAHDHPLAALVADLAQDDRVARLELTPLALPDAVRLASDLLQPLLERGEPRMGRQLVQRLASRSEGVPLFIVHLARSLRDLAAEREASALAAPDEDHDACREEPHALGIGLADLDRIPWGIAEHVRLRVAAVAPSARALLDVIAVAETATPCAVLAECVGRSEGEVLDDLEAGCRSGLLTPTPGICDEVGYRFAHELLREVVDADLNPGRRMLLHRVLGAALERQVGENWREREDVVPRLAYHFAHSGQPEKAAEHLRRAGDQARRMYAHRQAAVCYTQLVTLLDDLRREREAALARRDLADELAHLGRYAEALEALSRAAQTCRNLGDIGSLAMLTAAIASIHARRGTVDAGLAELRPLVERLEHAGGVPPQARAGLLATLAHLSFMDGQYDEALRTAERALEVAQATGDPRLIGRARLQIGVALLTLGDTSTAAESLDEARACGERAGHRELVLEALLMLIWTHQTRGEFETSLTVQCRALHEAEELGNLTCLGHAYFLQALYAYYVGDWPDARAYGERAAEAFGELDSSQLASYPPLGLGWLLLAQGRHQEAMRQLELARAVAERSDGEQVVRLIEELLAEDELVRDHGQAAYDRLAPLFKAGSLQERTRIELQTLRAWALLCLGKLAEADALVLDAVYSASEHAMDLLLPDALRVRAQCAIARGERVVAAEALAKALVVCKEMPFPYAEAKVRYVYGQFCLAIGDTELGREQLEQALAICEGLGERMYGTVIARALASARGERSAG